MGIAETAPDMVSLDRFLERPRFLAGQDNGRWKLLERDGTTLAVRINGVHYDSGTRASFEFRLECDGIPEVAPYVYCWDSAANARPTPIASSAPGVVDAFKDWTRPDGKHGGIYRAWQRYAADHNNWRSIRPDEAWHRGRELSFVMERLFELTSEHAAWVANGRS